MSARSLDCLVFATTLLLVPLTLAAQEEPPEFLSAVPESPAFTFLGTTPAEVSRPASARDFGLALINAVDPGGNVVAGFAIEATIWRLLPGVRVPLDEYQSNWWSYALANTQLSVGSVGREGEPGSTDLALGLKFTLLDRTDPMSDAEWTEDLGDALLPCLPEGPSPDEEEQKAVLECVDREIGSRWSAYTKARWNASRLSLSLAAGESFEEGDLDRSESAGFRAWLAGGAPLGSWGMGLGQAQFRDEPSRDEMPAAESLSLGVRLVAGSATVNGFLELISERVSAGGEEEDRTSWSVGVDVRIARDIWLSGGIGRRFESLLQADEEARTAVLANVKWGLTAKSRIATLRPSS